MSKTKSLALILGVFIMSFLVGYLIFAWTEPTQAPPAGNVTEPLNRSSNPQDKPARLTFTEFYDYNNTNYYVNPEGQSTFAGIRWLELPANGINFVGFKAPDSLTADTTYTLPTAYPAANGYVLSSTTAGTLSWTAAAGGGAPTGASYLVLGLDGTLTAERILVAGAGLTSTDGGANGNLTLNIGAGTGISVAADNVGLANPTKSCGAGFAIQSFDLGVVAVPTCIGVGGGGAPTDATYLVYPNLNATLTAERLLAVGAGSGLTLADGGANGNLTISTDFSTIQRRVTGTCLAGNAIRIINADGTVTCEPTGAGGLTGTGAANKVAFWTSVSNLSNNTNFHWDNTNTALGVGLAGVDTSYKITTSGGGIKADSTTSPAGYFNSSTGYGILSYGTTAGGFFNDSNSTGYAYIGYGNWGVYAGGTTGGYFTNSVLTATQIAYGNWGIYTSDNAYFGGNVGIGTDPGTNKLTVAGNTEITGDLKIGGLSKTYQFVWWEADGVSSCQSRCEAICTNGIVTSCTEVVGTRVYSSTNGSCTGTYFDNNFTSSRDVTLIQPVLSPACSSFIGVYDVWVAFRRMSAHCICP